MAGRYAEDTKVPVERSRVEIERTLTRYGADAFSYGWDRGRAVIMFQAHGRRIRFDLATPVLSQFSHTETGQPRSLGAAESAREKASRQCWRALLLIIKAKLEAVAAGIVTFEEEFLAHVMLPDGSNVADWGTAARARLHQRRDARAAAARAGGAPGRRGAMSAISQAHEREVARLKNQVRMFSEISAAATTQIGHGHPDSSPPPGVVITDSGVTHRPSTLELIGQRLDAAVATDDDAAVADAIEWAQAQARLITHGPPNRRETESDEQLAHRVLNDYEGLSQAEIVRRESGTTSPVVVKHIRENDRRDAKLGHKLPGEGAGR